MAKEPTKTIIRADSPSIGLGTGADSAPLGTGAGAGSTTIDTARDPLIAENGTAAQAAQAAEKPVVIGGAPVPVEPGGPGVGAARVAEESTGTVSRPLTPAAEVDLGLRGGALSEAERAELAELRRREAGRGLVVDAAKVAGQRFAVPATAIKRDGVLYGPDALDEAHRRVPVDFVAYTELVGIGAILKTPFHELEPVADD